MEKGPKRPEDRAILRALQENCRASLREIASAARAPISTVHEKIRRFEREGLVRAYRAVLDERKLGFEVTGFVLVSIRYGDDRLSQKKVAEQLARLPGVQEVHIVTGDWDLLVKAKARSVPELGRFVTERMRAIRGIDKTLTMVVFETAKETTALPL